MRKLLTAVFSVLTVVSLLFGCSGKSALLGGSFNVNDFFPIEKPGYYKWVFMTSDGKFYGRQPLLEEEIKDAGIVYQAEFNDNGQLSKITARYGDYIVESGGWIDSTLNRPGFAVVTIAYENGYVRYNFKDAGLNATKGFYGAYSIRYKMENDGTAKAAYLYNKNGEQADTGEGFAQMIFTYENGALRRIGFANKNGERVATADNVYDLRISHDDNSGNVLPSELANFGKDDALMQMKTGMAKIAFKYDDDKRLIEVRHFGTDEALRERNAGDFDERGVSSILPLSFSAGAITRYTYEGDKQTVSFLGKDEQAMGVAAWGGIASVVYERDAKRNVISISAFGTDGAPAPVDRKEYGNNVVKLQLGYNENTGMLNKMTLIGRDGTPVGAEGEFRQVATLTLESDGKGNLTQMAFFGTSGDPVEIVKYGATGVHKIVTEYNDDNEATLRIAYNRAGNEVYRDQIKPAQAQSGTPAAAPAPQAPPPAETHGVITGSEVRMRSGPGQNYSVLGHFNRGENITILGAQNGWFNVRRANGAAGWVSAQFCQPI